jgi:nitrate/nitrite transport system ATP-binding protein
MGFLEIKNVSHRYGAREVLRNVNLSLAEGEFVSIVGASASGKTTLLKAAAGLISPTAGVVEMNGVPMRGFSQEASIVFQNYSLLPWLSALENVQLAVESAYSGWSRDRQRERSVQYLETVGLGPALAKRPGQLSGGMRQRVAIARAFAVEPRLLFLDEPFGALDALTRATLQQVLANLCQAQSPRATVLMITNSIDEAILLSDRILALGRGPGASLSLGLEVDLPRPRPADLMAHNDDAVRVRAHLVELLTVAQVPDLRMSKAGTRPHQAVASGRGRRDGPVGGIRALTR